MAQKNVKVGNIKDISGEVNIAGGSIYKGFSSQEVSVLIADIKSTFQPKPFDGRCPYKGLDYFEEEDTEFFFGREQLVDDLVSRLKESRTLFVTGPSGGGKSSLVRAGLMHSLKQGCLKDSGRWLYGIMKPGREPIAELARVTAKLAKSTNAEDEISAKAASDPSIFRRWCEIALGDNKVQRVVIFIDQFEEIFTQINKEKANAFIDLLDNAVAIENGRVMLLFAMRSDFVSNCALFPKLNALLNQQFVQIGAMQPEELVSAIAQPALRVGLRIDPDLIAQIINDMQGEPGALPLMQFALKDLFDVQQAKGGVIALTLNDYLQRGGIRKALERHADDSFKKLSDHEQELARSIFSSLIEIGRGTQDTARTANFDELIPAGTNVADVEVIVHKLADARLITTDEVAGKDTVTLSHEKLIDAWPWLRKLVNENRDAIAMQNEIASDAKEWDGHHRDASYLYSGARLANAREQLGAKKLVLSGLASEFVQAGFAKRRSERLLRILSISGVIGLIIAGILLISSISTTNAQRLANQSESARKTQVAIANTAQAASTLAIFNQQEAVQAKATTESTLKTTQDQFRKARIQALSAQSEQIGKESPSASILLALEAIKLNQASNEPVSHEAYQALRDALTNAQGIPVEGNSEAVLAIQYSKVGYWFATGGKDGSVRVWDTKRSQVTGPFSFSFQCNQGEVQEIAFSNNDSQLISRGSNKTICIWDLSASDPSQTVDQLKVDLPTIDDFSVSSDGHWAAAGSVEANQVLVWDLKNSKLLDMLEIGDNASLGPLHLAFNPEGTILLVAEDSALAFWSIKTTGLERMPGGGPLTSDGSALVANSLIHIRQLQFTPDGQRIIGLGYSDYSAGDIIFILNATTFLKSPTIYGIKSANGYGYESLQQISISPDGRWLAGGNNNTIWLWNLTSLGHNPVRLAGHQAPINALTFSKDGHWLASATGPLSDDSNVQGDGSVRLWDLQATNPAEAPTIISASLDKNLLAFNSRSNWLTVSNGDQLIRLFDLTTKKFSIEPLEFSDSLTLSGYNNSGGNTATNWRILYDPYDRSYRIGNALALPLPILMKLIPGTSIYGYRANENQPVYAKCETGGGNCDVSEVDVYLGTSPAAQKVIWDDQFIRTITTVHFTEDKHWMFITGYGSDGYGLYLVNLTERSPYIRKPYHILLAPYYWGDVRYLGSNVFNNRWLFASTDAGLTYLDLNLPDPVTTRKYMSGIIPVALSPDGHWLANEVIAGGKLGLFDLNKLDQGATANISLSTPFSGSSEVLFSADSHWLMFSNDTQFSIWDVSKTSPDSAVLNIPISLTRRRLSQDQQWLGLLDKSGKITIVNLSGDTAAITDLSLDAQGRYMDLAFSVDGRWFGAVDKTGNLSLYDLSNTGKEPLLLNRALNALTSLAFNLDKNNSMVVGGTANGKILIWNLSDLLNSPNSLPIILQGGVKAYDQIAFTPDGNWLLAYGANEPLKAWRANFEDILSFACEAAGRNLSRGEWTRYGFTEDYRATCPQWEIGK